MFFLIKAYLLLIKLVCVIEVESKPYISCILAAFRILLAAALVVLAYMLLLFYVLASAFIYIFVDNSFSFCFTFFFAFSLHSAFCPVSVWMFLASVGLILFPTTLFSFLLQSLDMSFSTHPSLFIIIYLYLTHSHTLQTMIRPPIKLTFKGLIKLK